MNKQYSSPVTTEAFIIRFLLEKAKEHGQGALTPLQVNKLAYILHGWTLGLFDKPLFDNSNNQIQARRYGPVVVGIYHTLKRFEDTAVSLRTIKFNSRRNPVHSYQLKNIEILAQSFDTFMEKQKVIVDELDKVYCIYADLGGGKLIDLTHGSDSPWDQCRPRGLGIFGFGGQNHIPDSVIGPYYKRFIGIHFS